MKQNARSSQAVSAYQQAALTVSPAVAVVLAYDKSIVLVQRAILAIEAKRLDEAFGHVNRVAAILRGLSHILNFERGGGLAERLFRTYGQLILALYASFGKPDAIKRYRTLITALRDLREAWSFVARAPRKVDGAKPAVSAAATAAASSPPVAARARGGAKPRPAPPVAAPSAPPRPSAAARGNPARMESVSRNV